jgi:hypothetical protein
VSGDRTAGFLARLDAVEERLRRHAAGEPPRGLTEPDPPTGERWEAGQVWAHVAEFVPYWIQQLRGLIDRDGGEPEPFGRTKADPGRIAAIERDRHEAIPDLYERTRAAIEELRAWLPSLDEAGWSVVGRHQTMGDLDGERIVEEFLVGHLEQHADQLDGLSHRPPG